MPSTHEVFVGDGVGDLPPGGVPGVVGGAVDGVPPGVVGDVPPEVGLLEGLPVGLEGPVDGFLPDFVLPGDPVSPGAVTPLVGWDPSDEPGEDGDGTWPRVGLPVAGDPTGSRFAAGVLLNAPDMSSATRPTLAAAIAPIAIVPVFRRREEWG